MDIKAEKEESADSKCKHTSHDKRCKIFSRNLSADDLFSNRFKTKKKTKNNNKKQSKIKIAKLHENEGGL